MADEHWEKQQALFHRAKEMTEEERKAFLDAECRDDPDLRAEVEKLLTHADTELESTVIQNDPPETRIPNDTRIGNYVIRGFIGEGGFGDVYLAEQTAPVRRRQVALKIIKPGMDTRQVIARFEAERQALALMDHPHVAKVFDAGATEQGRSYFVMEYIAGVPITEHCDRQKLNVKERLALFIKVCEAVQHAHQKGIIHRDLKPNNILVAPTPVETQGKEIADDAVGVPKVIDFGIAKALNQPLSEKTIFTETGQIIGTPDYMSPEQAEMTGQGIDTRSDVYSLGVLLYELLTGALPFDRGTLRGVVFDEIRRIIREVTPKKPSTRLGSLADTPVPTRSAGRDEGTSAEYSAQRRQTNTRTLLKALRGDLDWITMMCLEKDRTRRYETATALANDIRRHLNNEPVRAGPPSRVYRTRKFVRRNRGFVIAATLVFAVLLGGVISTGIALSREAEQRRLAIQESERAKKEAAKAKQTAKFTKEMLSSVKPEIAKDMDKTLVRLILDNAAKRIETELSDQPEVEAEIRGTIGIAYLAIGEYDAAQEQLVESADLFRRSLGENDPETLRSDSTLANLYFYQGDIDKTETLFREIAVKRERILGEEHPDTLTSWNNLAVMYLVRRKYEDALALHTKVLKIRTRILGEDDPDTLSSMHNLANVYGRLRRMDESMAMNKKVLEARKRVLPEGHPDIFKSMNNIAINHEIMKNYSEAERYHLKILQARERYLGEGHPETLKSVNNLITIYYSQGQVDKAMALYIDTMDRWQRTIGEDNLRTQDLKMGLGNLYENINRLSKAEQIYREILNTYIQQKGTSHRKTLGVMELLANLYLKQGRLNEAEPLFEKFLEAMQSELEVNDPKVIQYTANLAMIYMEQGRYEKAERQYQLVLANLDHGTDEPDADTVNIMNNLASLYQKQRKYDQAEEQYQEVLDLRMSLLGERHSDTLGTMTNLAHVYKDTGRLREAEELYRRALKTMREVMGIHDAWTRSAMKGLATVLEREGLSEKAIPLRRELLEYTVSQARHTKADGNILNAAARELLTIKPTELRDPEMALGFALNANEQTESKNAGYLDTLALAYHRTGDMAKAIETQEKAIALLPPDDSQTRKDMEARLVKYRQAFGSESSTTQPATNRPDRTDNGPAESPSSQPADYADRAVESLPK